MVIILVENDEADRARASQLQDDRIHPGDVIGQEQKAAARQVFASERGDAVDEPPERKDNEVKRAFGERGVRHCLWFTICGAPTAIGNSNEEQN